MEIATICFLDHDSGDEATMVVRTIGEATGLTLSLRRNGDVEVFFGKQELALLIEALQKVRAASPG